MYRSSCIFHRGIELCESVSRVLYLWLSHTHRAMPSNWIYAIVTRYSILLPNKRLPFHTLLFKCRHLYYDNDFFKVVLLLIHICTSSQITWYALTISVLCSLKWIHNTSSPLRFGSDHKIIRFIFARKKIAFPFCVFSFLFSNQYFWTIL